VTVIVTTGIASRIELLNQRRLGTFRQLIEATVEILSRTSLNRQHPRSRSKLELDNHARNAPRACSKRIFVDSADGVDRFLDRFGDSAPSVSSGAAPGRKVVTITVGTSTLGKQIDAEAHVREPSEHDQHADEHRGEDRTAGTQRSARITDCCSFAITVVPSARPVDFRWTATRSPSFKACGNFQPGRPTLRFRWSTFGARPGPTP